MKNVVLYERIPTKFILYFSQLYLICNKFLKFRNVYMYRCIDKKLASLSSFLSMAGSTWRLEEADAASRRQLTSSSDDGGAVATRLPVDGTAARSLGQDGSNTAMRRSSYR
jgi:hypothetical protein